MQWNTIVSTPGTYEAAVVQENSGNHPSILSALSRRISTHSKRLQKKEHYHFNTGKLYDQEG